MIVKVRWIRNRQMDLNLAYRELQKEIASTLNQMRESFVDYSFILCRHLMTHYQTREKAQLDRIRQLEFIIEDMKNNEKHVLRTPSNYGKDELREIGQNYTEILRNSSNEKKAKSISPLKEDKYASQSIEGLKAMVEELIAKNEALEREHITARNNIARQYEEVLAEKNQIIYSLGGFSSDKEAILKANNGERSPTSQNLNVEKSTSPTHSPNDKREESKGSPEINQMQELEFEKKVREEVSRRIKEFEQSTNQPIDLSDPKSVNLRIKQLENQINALKLENSQLRIDLTKRAFAMEPITEKEHTEELEQHYKEIETRVKQQYTELSRLQGDRQKEIQEIRDMLQFFKKKLSQRQQSPIDEKTLKTWDMSIVMILQKLENVQTFITEFLGINAHLYQRIEHYEKEIPLLKVENESLRNNLAVAQQREQNFPQSFKSFSGFKDDQSKPDEGTEALVEQLEVLTKGTEFETLVSKLKSAVEFDKEDRMQLDFEKIELKTSLEALKELADEKGRLLVALEKEFREHLNDFDYLSATPKQGLEAELMQARSEIKTLKQEKAVLQKHVLALTSNRKK